MTSATRLNEFVTDTIPYSRQSKGFFRLKKKCERETRTMSIPHPIPYQGSKRGLARAILAYFPVRSERLVEPFAGSASMSIAAAYFGLINSFWLNDLNRALIDLWEQIINEPDRMANGYESLWRAQQGQEREFYNMVRARFNHRPQPEDFLYLLARCVKGSVRYNAYGEFNQSPDNRRRGMHPRTMRKLLHRTSQLLNGKTCLTAMDYREVLVKVSTSDIVYMDPPYQGVSRKRDPRYYKNTLFDEFVEALTQLNDRRIAFIISYDGRTGSKRFGRSLPKHLSLTHIEIDAGRSTQATLLGRTDRTVESLYLSPALVGLLANVSPPELKRNPKQISLFEVVR